MKTLIAFIVAVSLTSVAYACPQGICNQRIVQRQQYVVQQQVYAAPIVQQVYAVPVIQQQVQYVQPQVQYVQQVQQVQKVRQVERVRLRLQSPIVRQKVVRQKLVQQNIVY